MANTYIEVNIPTVYFLIHLTQPFFTCSYLLLSKNIRLKLLKGIHHFELLVTSYCLLKDQEMAPHSLQNLTAIGKTVK